MFFALQALIILSVTGKSEASTCRIVVTYNNIPCAAQLKTSWGFSCVVQGFDRTVLFDAGGDGEVLLANMALLGLDPKAIDVVMLSHNHGDHTGGLKAFLKKNSEVRVYFPRSFPSSFKDTVTRMGAAAEAIGEPKKLFDGVHSTGEVGDGIKEEAMILETAEGLVIITGCAHPGVVKLVQKAKGYLKKPVFLIMGGFHLMGMEKSEIDAQIRALKALGVAKVAPSHCTGKAAIERFRKAWRGDFIPGGCGAVIEIPR